MVKCYFDNNFNTLFDCDYSNNNNVINVTIYENSTNFRSESLFENELQKQPLYYSKIYNITILDYKNRKFYKLYNAIKLGTEMGEGNVSERFKSDVYLFTQKLNNIKKVDNNSDITSIKLYNEFFQYLFPIKCLLQKRNEDFYEIRVEKNLPRKDIYINSNNVKKLSLLDECLIKTNHENSINVNINTCKCCEIVLNKSIKFFEVFKYITDFDAYFNLIFNESRRSYKVLLKIINEYFELTYKDQFSYTTKNSSLPIIEGDYFEFIKRCYCLLPFDKKSDYKYNIKIISLYNDYKNMEDIFMSYYRFIEFYYKSNGKKHFIEYIVNKYEYIFKDYFSSAEMTKDFPFEIISLRNHYAHTGYYIKNNKLRVEKNRQFLYYKDIDTLWIAKLMKCLKKVFYKIVLLEILGYDEVNLFLLN